MDTVESIKDKMAKAVHDIWSHWMVYYLHHDKPWGVNDYKRWGRQCKADFNDLSDEEKKSDYEVAEKCLSEVSAILERLDERIEKLDIAEMKCHTHYGTLLLRELLYIKHGSLKTEEVL